MAVTAESIAYAEKLVAEKKTTRGLMLAARKERHITAVIKWKKANKDSVKLYRAEYWRKNKEKYIGGCRKRSNQWYYNNKERHIATVRKCKLLRAYNLTLDAWDELLIKQGGKCAICPRVEPGGKYNVWSIDHCHISGKVRGLVCRWCNTMLGMSKDNPETLRAAATYLEKHNEQSASGFQSSSS